MEARRVGCYHDAGKRFLDIVGASGGLLLLAPFLLIVSVAVLVSVGRPVLFRQPRAGRHGKTFHIVKFRTMTDGSSPSGDLLPDDRRLTRVGRLLRALSLDELPELLNVLTGEMSLIGPRPLLTQYVSRYSSSQARRLEVRPGITGWAQVNGRNSVAWEDRFALDVWYVDNYTFALDVRILLRTLIQVLRRDGISAEGHATMPEFEG